MNITLCVLASAANQKYTKRLLNFVQNFGYKHTNKNINLKVVFLVSNEDKPNFIDNKYHWYNCGDIDFSLRFLHYLINENIESDWIMQVDDDSSTDIDKTCEILHQYYNHDDCMAITCGNQHDIDVNLQNVVRHMGVNNFFFNSNNVNEYDRIPYVSHAWEASILSKTACDRLRNWEDMVDFLDKCKQHKPKFSDQIPYIAIKLAKIPICQGTFMTPMFKFRDFSALNKTGRYSHIHYVINESKYYSNFNKKMRKVKDGDYIMKNENLWNFYAKDNGVFRHIAILELKPDGTIGRYKNKNEKYWEQKDNKIIFKNVNKIPTSILEENEPGRYSGPVLSNDKTVHYLEKQS